MNNNCWLENCLVFVSKFLIENLRYCFLVRVNISEASCKRKLHFNDDGTESFNNGDTNKKSKVAETNVENVVASPENKEEELSGDTFKEVSNGKISLSEEKNLETLEETPQATSTPVVSMKENGLNEQSISGQKSKVSMF